jgi:hypothetical protein
LKVGKNSVEDLIPPQLTGKNHPVGNGDARSMQTQADYLAKAKSIIGRVKSPGLLTFSRSCYVCHSDTV